MPSAAALTHARAKATAVSSPVGTTISLMVTTELVSDLAKSSMGRTLSLCLIPKRRTGTHSWPTHAATCFSVSGPVTQPFSISLSVAARTSSKISGSKALVRNFSRRAARSAGARSSSQYWSYPMMWSSSALTGNAPEGGKSPTIWKPTARSDARSVSGCPMSSIISCSTSNRLSPSTRSTCGSICCRTFASSPASSAARTRQ
mmetsp:Transcript_100010/g.305713  ORF Transcript_100010/g.305713 Transcript_100010/m.305713 type:complete len:203 (-) Transcript_100010:383-991(-)